MSSFTSERIESQHMTFTVSVQLKAQQNKQTKQNIVTGHLDQFSLVIFSDAFCKAYYEHAIWYSVRHMYFIVK